MRRFTALTAGLVFALGLSTANAAIIFDDFNVNVGTHFNSAPNSSSTTNILRTTAGHVNATTRVTAAPFEGAGNLNLHIEGNGTAVSSPAFPRIRFTSGGGTPANNIAFTTTAGTDGFIGYYYKVPASGTLPGSLPSGLQLTLNLDGPGGAAAAADAGIAKNAIMDGQWHLVEWNLDLPSDWGPFQGVGGNGVLENGNSYTIDSIYFRYPVGTTWTGYTGIQDLQIDFVAKSDSGSIAGLLNSPPTVTDAVINNVNASLPGNVQHLFAATDTQTPAGPFTWDQLTFVGYTQAYGGAGVTGPTQPGGSDPAMLTGNQFDWNTVGSPRGIYQWSVRGTDPGGLSDTGTLTVHVTEVPEPSTLALFSLAMVGAMGLCRRK
jgi:hypothetical protein